MISVPEMFSAYVFDHAKMKKWLKRKDYNQFLATVNQGNPLSKELATAVAEGMKNWAISMGATHYTHWFQPMTGITAEKHDSFICPTEDGKVIMKFSGKELIKSEGDASSFPNGGLRSTFEARGYTVWDPTSFAFIKDGALCIPTAFCTFSGQVLDKKTPLLRSTKAVSTQAKRLLNILGKQTKEVIVTVGAEQEYFLIDKKNYLQRKDLMFTGRTLFGSNPAKGQEMEDHYYGNIRPRVLAFMEELDRELWKFGILAKTRHNEVAPAQHELAPIFTTVNVAADQNQLTMEIMKKIAEKHDLICLLNEKPFKDVNGSGKHDNWSMSTDSGENLFEPGKNPKENRQFLLFLSAVITAVDRHQDLLRLSVASASNDHRLGASEAPPAIVSMYIGEELEGILENLSSGKTYDEKEASNLDTASGIKTAFKKDNTDRNRTSPFAFTGNKFEFRMLGSECNISCPTTMINVAVAEALDEICSRLEKATDLNGEILNVIKEYYCKHKRIIFNGNGYGEEWKAIAKERGLLNLENTPSALVRYNDKKNVELLEKYGVLNGEEIDARMEILLENYCKTINIEARTMLEMTKREIIPACITSINELAETIRLKKKLDLSRETETKILERTSALLDEAYTAQLKLEEVSKKVKAESDIVKKAKDYHDQVLSAMNELRKPVDELEKLVAKKYWPFPAYSDILYSV